MGGRGILGAVCLAATCSAGACVLPSYEHTSSSGDGAGGSTTTSIGGSGGTTSSDTAGGSGGTTSSDSTGGGGGTTGTGGTTTSTGTGGGCEGAGCVEWAVVHPATGQASGVALSVAGDGGILFGGDWVNKLEYDPAHSVDSAGALDGFVLWTSSAGAYVGDLALSGGDTEPTSQTVTAVAHGPDGSLFVGGTFVSKVQLSPEVAAGAGPGNLLDGFVAKYGPGGKYQWGITFGGTKDDAATAIAVDSNGDVWVTGTYAGTATFPGGQMTSTSASIDVFLLKLDGGDGMGSGGGGLFQTSCGSVGPDESWDLDVDGQGDVAFVGRAQGSFGCTGGGSFVPTGAQSFVVRHGNGGIYLWGEPLGTTGGPVGRVLATSPIDDGIQVAGVFDGVADFGVAGMLSDAGGARDLFVVKLSPVDGAPMPGTAFSIADVHPADAKGLEITMAAAPGGGFTLAGSFAGTTDLGGGPVTSDSGGTGVDAFAVRFDPAGQYVAHSVFTGAGVQRIRAIGFGATGGPVVGGDFAGPIDFGDGAPSTASAGTFLARLPP